MSDTNPSKREEVKRQVGGTKPLHLVDPPPGVSQNTWTRVLAFRDNFQNYYKRMMTYKRSREFRMKELRQEIRERGLSREIANDLMQTLKARETILLRTLRLGVSVNDFKVLYQISRGGFSTVYLCKHRTTGEILCLKRMVKEIQPTQALRIRTERTVLIRAACAAYESNPKTVYDKYSIPNAHKFLLGLKYAFQDSKFLYFVTEFAQTGDLAGILNICGRLPEVGARFYTAEIIAAIDALHSQGFVHRDLKPQNFLVEANGHIKLADFGLARMLVTSGMGSNTIDRSWKGGRGLQNSSSYKTPVAQGNSTGPSNATSRDTSPIIGSYSGMAFSIVGTPSYMAPEVIAGYGYGKSADLWSLGVMLYEMICGIPPFNGATAEEIFLRVEENGFTPPNRPDDVKCSDECWDLICQLLTEPNQRLGAGKKKRTMRDLKKHKFFMKHPTLPPVKWNDLYSMKPFLVPKFSSPTDLRFFKNAKPVDPKDPFGTKSSELSTSALERSNPAVRFALDSSPTSCLQIQLNRTLRTPTMTPSAASLLHFGDFGFVDNDMAMFAAPGDTTLTRDMLEAIQRKREEHNLESFDPIDEEK